MAKVFMRLMHCRRWLSKKGHMLMTLLKSKSRSCFICTTDSILR